MFLAEVKKVKTNKTKHIWKSKVQKLINLKEKAAKAKLLKSVESDISKKLLGKLVRACKETVGKIYFGHVGEVKEVVGEFVIGNVEQGCKRFKFHKDEVEEVKTLAARQAAKPLQSWGRLYKQCCLESVGVDLQVDPQVTLDKVELRITG